MKHNLASWLILFLLGSLVANSACFGQGPTPTPTPSSNACFTLQNQSDPKVVQANLDHALKNECKDGGKIFLGPTIMPAIVVHDWGKDTSNKDSRLSIVGTQGGEDTNYLRGITIKNSERVDVNTMNFMYSFEAEELGEPLIVEVISSTDITFNANSFTHTTLHIDADSQQVRILSSYFAQCAGDYLHAEMNVDNRCVFIEGKQITIDHSAFHDCFDCDFIHGHGSNVTITNNVFENGGTSKRCDVCPGLPGAPAPTVCGLCKTCCNHNDLVQIQGGSDWLIDNNRFGNIRYGGGQLAISGSDDKTTIKNVLVQNNSFYGQSGSVSQPAISVTMGKNTPEGVRIINNCVLTDVPITSIDLNMPLRSAARPSAEYPFIDGNTLLKISQQDQCAMGIWGTNFSKEGSPCLPSSIPGYNPPPAPAPHPLCATTPIPIYPTLTPGYSPPKADRTGFCNQF